MENSNFSIPPAFSEASPSDVPFLPPKKTDEKEMPTVTEKDVFFRAIMEDKVYTKSYYLFNDKTEVIFRTRWTTELEEIAKKLVINPSGSLLDYQLTSGLYALAYALVRVNEQNFDTGTLDERCTRLKSLSGPKISLLMLLLNKFDSHINELQKQAASPNF